MMYGYGYGWSWGGVLFMMLSTLFWIGLFALVLWAIVRAVRGGGPSGNGRAQPSALEILQQRYARGEIDTKTYDEMLARLNGSMTSAPPTSVGMR
jgi:putative membrane protein